MDDHSEETEIRCWVGIDVSAATTTVVWQAEQMKMHQPVTIDQTAEGMNLLMQRLAATAISAQETLVVMEATGSYWATLATMLHASGYQVSILNPAHARFFAQSYGLRAKTDRVDARMLCRLARERQPRRWTPPPDVYHDLRQRLVARAGLVQMRHQAFNQRHALQQWPVQIAEVQQCLTETIQALDVQIRQITASIATVLADSAWAESATLLATIPGIGPVTTAWLLMTTLNFTVAENADRLTAYAGLAPMERSSGTSVWSRPSIGHSGNGQLRTALYLATLSAARYNPVIKVVYDRLRAAGKPPKVARCAAARKLLHLARAVVVQRRPFDAQYQTKVISAPEQGSAVGTTTPRGAPSSACG